MRVCGGSRIELLFAGRVPAASAFAIRSLTLAAGGRPVSFPVHACSAYTVVSKRPAGLARSGHFLEDVAHTVVFARLVEKIIGAQRETAVAVLRNCVVGEDDDLRACRSHGSEC